SLATLTARLSLIFLSIIPPPPRSTLFPYTTLFRSSLGRGSALGSRADERRRAHHALERPHCHARGHRSRITGLARWIRESCERLARRTPGQSVPRRRRRRAPSSARLKPAHRGASCGPACIWPK